MSSNAPNAAKIQDLKRRKLVVESTDDRPIRFDRQLSSPRWVLLAKGERRLSIAEVADSGPSSQDILSHRYPQGRTWREQRVWITSRCEIPEGDYEAWTPTQTTGPESSDSKFRSFSRARQYQDDSSNSSGSSATETEEFLEKGKGKAKAKAEPPRPKREYHFRSRTKRARSPIELSDGSESDGWTLKSKGRELRSKKRKVTLGAATESFASLDLSAADNSRPDPGYDSDCIQLPSPGAVVSQLAGPSHHTSNADTPAISGHEVFPVSDDDEPASFAGDHGSASHSSWMKDLGFDIAPPQKNPWAR
ncbi:hypothetical protein DENSPDRAFT_877658 [Dentipellis sp. KUC8613]|nr:hypothetical protein DENSPDRAFT_877658 [Dentipellis sp. KUC8613]